ncbi:MAG TPA: class I SAM-dependent methyltransferase [Thermoflexus sp.]|nr:class I SAM-dependent methyltransferase [Thermoflexus sp.]
MDNMDLSNLEGMFYESIYRYGESDPDWNREVLGFYVPFFADCHRVLDLGCGRGEFLELLREKGISGTGIDVDLEMVRTCREKGLEVIQADLFEYLGTQEASWDGIFCSNVIEHMHADKALRMFQLAYRALRPGGIFLVATPNPESLIVHLYEFWRDPTHVRLYNLPLLKFMMEYVGFRNVRGGENPKTRWDSPWTEISIQRLEIPEESFVELLSEKNIERRKLTGKLLYILHNIGKMTREERILIENLMEIIGIKKAREIYGCGVKANE